MGRMPRQETKKTSKPQASAAKVSQHVMPPEEKAAAQAEKADSDEHERLLANYRVKIDELGKQNLSLQRKLDAAEQKVTRLSSELGTACNERDNLSAELDFLKEMYLRVGPGTVALANRFDALKRRVPWLMSPLGSIVRALS